MNAWQEGAERSHQKEASSSHDALVVVVAVAILVATIKASMYHARLSGDAQADPTIPMTTSSPPFPSVMMASVFKVSSYPPGLGSSSSNGIIMNAIRPAREPPASVHHYSPSFVPAENFACYPIFTL